MLISKFNNESINESMGSFEYKYGFKFPNQYKLFLLRYNGGKTPNTSFKINKISSDISGFYGLGIAEKYYNFQALENSYGFNEWIEDNMLPIGKNSFGDYIMLGIGSDNNGKIYFYYHDRPKKYIELANSFELFLDKCKSEKVGHIRSLDERKNDMIKLGKGNKITPEKIAGWQAEIDEYANIKQEELILD